MRYIGNKAKLLNEITKLLEAKGLNKEGLVFCDAFSGTATVGNHFNDFYKIIANDILDLSYQYSTGLLLYKNTNFIKLGFDPFDYFNNYDTHNYLTGFCYNNFSPNGNCQYFSDENAKKIDFIRDSIDKWYNEDKITKDEKSYLIACLLEAISKVSNVAGVYSAFLKKWDSRALKDMIFLPITVKTTRFQNETYCCDAIELISKTRGDILYLDPPYTPTQYNSQYHVLETITRNDFPKTHGVGKHRENDRMSKWCKKGNVEFEFERIIKEANYKHIVFSYSDKGIMSPQFIEAVLKRYGKAETYEFRKISFVKYKSTRAVNKEIVNGTKKAEHYEYLFYIEKKEEPQYVSPLNYIGGKFNSLDLIKNNSPKKVEVFYDLFGGGSTVGLNSNARAVVYNDINPYVVSLLQFLSKTHPTDVYKQINKYIKKFNLNKGNKEAYVKLREEYNKTKKDILLYLLICFGFEHQIRFNSNHDFNNPCGNSAFNDEMYEKIISFYLRCQDIDITFCCDSYEKYADRITAKDFVYLDPPYLSTNGAYQDGKRGFNGWDCFQEQQLHIFIEQLNRMNIPFMFSNYTDHTSGNKNELENWCRRNSFLIVKSEKIIKRNRQHRREIVVINKGALANA